MMVAFLLAIFFTTLILGFPIFASLVLSAMSTVLLFMPNIAPTVMIQRMVGGIDVFSLLSIPGFLLTAEVIGKGQIGKRLIQLARALVGHLYGGLAISVILACLIFGAISGAGAAGIVAIGSIVYPILLEAGYGKKFSIGLILSSSTLAMLVPPGIAMILYSTLTNNSIGTVFMAGLASSIVIALALAVYSVIYSIKNQVPLQKRATLREVLKSAKESVWALGLPIIIVGGIYSGYFTATEAASIAAVYAIIIETLVYKNLTRKSLWEVVTKVGANTSMIFMLISAGALLSYVLTVSQISQMIVGIVGDYSSLVRFLLINLIFLGAGMFMDPNSAIIVFVPLLYRVAIDSGINPIQLGIVIVFNLAIGMLTPPFGLNLFVGTQVLDTNYAEAVRACIPFLLIMLLTLVLITLFPNLTLWFI